MTKIDYWADAPLNREQIALFSPTLDAMIAADDPVRLVDEVLAGIDWCLWEAEYDGRRGQPPIHPRFVAAAYLYGLCRGIKSTRKLEEACCYRFDFMWLVEGRRIDHTSFSKFRTRFKEPLRGLFQQLCRIAMDLGLVRLGEVAFDGTRTKANNSRYQTRTAKTLAEKLAALDQLFEEKMAEFETNDAQQQQSMFEGEDSQTRLPPDLADLNRRRCQVREALEKAQAADEARRKQGVNPDKNPAQIPTTDPDSRVMPNKEGGYAPNYTPTAITDGHRGFIIDCDVTNDVHESGLLPESLDRVQETFGTMPEKLLTDGGNNSGYVIQEVERRGVEFFAPVASHQPQEGNPAHRDDPTQPVPPEQWPQLPRNTQGKLDKSTFIYDAAHDQYYCPQGQAMPFETTKPNTVGGIRITRRIYRSPVCTGCALFDMCVNPTAKHGRTITRDEFEDIREKTAQRMASAAAREIYNQRPRIAETTFGIIKSVIGLRQFLLRGLEKVKIEWCWAVTALNLGKLVRELARLRAEVNKLATNGES